MHNKKIKAKQLEKMQKFTFLFNDLNLDVASFDSSGS